MKKISFHALFLLIFLFAKLAVVPGQTVLEPGFDAHEYAILLNTTEDHKKLIRELPALSGYEHVYRSEPAELDNLFDIWLGKNGTVILEIRGTTAKTKSWLENFYSGMVPAEGTLEVREGEKFHYKLADIEGAAVHIGWLTGLATMIDDILEQISTWHDEGFNEFIIMGHSQGGAIAFLLDSYLHYDIDHRVADDIIFKTYNSAAPKPGNLYYAYDYEYINRGGWAIRIVNPLDWVPETPISVQTLEDFNEVNPFVNMDIFTENMGWLEKVVINSIFRKTDRSLRKAQKRLLKYLGFKMYDFMDPYLPGMQEPEYLKSMNYSPAGNTIILPPNEAYYNEYLPSAKENVFRHHYGAAYYFLLKQHYDIRP